MQSALCVSKKANQKKNKKTLIYLRNKDARPFSGCLWQVYFDTLILLKAAAVKRALPESKGGISLRKPDASLLFILIMSTGERWSLSGYSFNG